MWGKKEVYGYFACVFISLFDYPLFAVLPFAALIAAITFGAVYSASRAPKNFQP